MAENEKTNEEITENEINGTHYRSIQGKVAAIHGTNGVVCCIFDVIIVQVRVIFRRHLPPTAIGKTVRVMLYPSRV